MQFSMLPLQGITQGAQPIISFNYGAGNRDRVKRTFFLLLRTCVIYSVALWAVAIFVPKLFIMIFTSDPELTDYTIWAIRIYLSLINIYG